MPQPLRRLLLRLALLLTLVPGLAAAAEGSFSLPDYASPQLSPDGRYLAMLAKSQQRMRLAVYDLELGRFESFISAGDADISDIRWLGNEHLLYSLAQYGQSRRSLARQGGLFLTRRDGQDSRKVYQTLADWLGKMGRSTRRYTRMWPIQTVPGSSEELIVATDEADKDSTDLYRLNAFTGKRQLLTGQRPPRVTRWVLDAQLRPRVAIASEPASTELVVHYREPDGPWRELWRCNGARGDIKLPLSVEADGKLLVASNEGRDTVALREYAPASGAWGETLIEHPQYDVAVDALGDEAGELLYDERSHELLGVRIDAARPLNAWMDAGRQALQARVDQALPGRFNELQFSGGEHVFVESRSDRQASQWYLLNLGNGQLRKVLDSRPGRDPRGVPATEVLNLRSRDGQALLAYRLRPVGAKPGTPLPTVVLVHGGPWARGPVWGEQGDDIATAQWLTTQGYQVLLPSFRGSVGFGKRWLQSSRSQFGLAMQDDLDDALDFLLRRGDADPQRLCIMGASYGGYASLMAVARTPERYRCAVAGFPVTDLPQLLSSGWSDLSSNADKREFWIEMAGDPVKQRAELQAVSPRHLAARIKAGVMIYAGVDDRRAPLEQAEGMRDALERAGNKPLWLAKYGEGHGFGLDSNRDEMRQMLSSFLARHLHAP